MCIFFCCVSEMHFILWASGLHCYLYVGCIAVEKWAALFFLYVGCIAVYKCGLHCCREVGCIVIFICGLHCCRDVGCIDVYNSGLHSIFSLYMFFGFCVLY